MRWFRRHRTEPTDLERRASPRPEAFERELATWLGRETWGEVCGRAPGRLSDGTTPRDNSAQDDWPSRSLPASLVRGLVALLAAPFLLLAVLVIGCWLKASGRLPSGVWQR
jgi:hypothetical protein